MLSAVYQRTRRADPRLATSFEEVERALSDFQAFGSRIVSPPELYPRTLTFARDHGLARTYDAIYVVLAQLLGASSGRPTGS